MNSDCEYPVCGGGGGLHLAMRNGDSIFSNI